MATSILLAFRKRPGGEAARGVAPFERSVEALLEVAGVAAVRALEVNVVLGEHPPAGYPGVTFAGPGGPDMMQLAAWSGVGTTPPGVTP